VTLAPLGWLLAVTMSAGWLKIFSTDPRVGFLSANAGLKTRLAEGGPAAQLAEWRHLQINNDINAAVTGVFLVLVLLVVIVSVREWLMLLSKRRPVVLREEPYVAVAAAEAREPQLALR
jgi:carbon starvation protein